MNITFLIGNGFDLNLRLKTRYHDFYGEYLKPLEQETLDTDLFRFKDEIRTSLDLWSNAEERFGEQPEKIIATKADSDPLDRLFNRHTNFVKALADYLKNQEDTFFSTFFNSSEQQTNATSAFIDDILRLRETIIQQELIKTLLQGSRQSSLFNLNFINFNYTKTLDSIIHVAHNQIGDNASQLQFPNTVYHVHGILPSPLLLGVNDDSQVKNVALFNGRPHYYKDILVKPRANAERDDINLNEVEGIILKSHVIIIYGMSLGMTDKLWWEKVTTWMRGNGNRLILFHSHDTIPIVQGEALRFKYNIYRRLFPNDDIINSLRRRTLITDKNFFHSLAQSLH